MAEPPSTEGVASLVAEDNRVEETDSTFQLEHPSPSAVANTKTEVNGTAHDIRKDENGTATQTLTSGDLVVESRIIPESDSKSQADKGDMPTKPASASGKRVATNSAKSGTASTTKAGPMGTAVKKVLSSGTFGTSQAKPPALTSKTSTGPGMSSSTTTKPSPTPTAGKTPSTSHTASAKPVAASTKPTTSTPATSTAARRTSIAPTGSKPLSSSTGSRPSITAPSAKAPPITSTTRASVTSPSAASDSLRSSTGTGANRPRASVSDGVPGKKPAAPRPSLPASKAPSASGLRTLRTAGSSSISSLKEVKEDNKAIQELEEKYKTAASSLESNLEKVKELETQVEATKATLASTEAERHGKHKALEAIQILKDALESELKMAQNSLDGEKAERESREAELLQVREELKAAQESAMTQTTLVSALQEQIKAIEVELASAKEAITTNQSSHEKALVEAGSVEREALLRARADLEAVKAESNALIAAQKKAEEETTERIQALEAEVAKSSSMSGELEQLKRHEEELHSKIAEVEVEVLELREAAELATDEQAKALTRVKTLEQELATASEANAVAVEASRVKEEEHNTVLENLKELETQLAVALENQKASQADLQAKEEEHALKVAEIQRLHEEGRKTVTEELQRTKADLESQETKYASQLDEVKAEHASLLEQAFQKAKSEAGTEHAQELQSLRAQSQATIEQLRQAHQVTLDDANASHQEALETQVRTLEKQISNLNLELKATQEDLAKAKAGLEAALALEGTLRTQIEQKDAESIAARPPVDQSEEVNRLTKELLNAKDDLLNITEAFNASKESFQQISGNHQVELEEAAKFRAEEVTKLRAMHDDELNGFKRERDELVARISELEVELATLKATAEAQPSAMPLSPRKDANGAVPGSSAVTKEELQRMHEAHNLKLYELEANHEQTVKGLTEKLEATSQLAQEQQSLAERLQMEVNFAEQSAEENEDELKQLRDEVEHLKVQLQLAGAGP